MASILMRCPACHTYRAVAAKKCSCGIDFDTQKKQGKVRYAVKYLVEGKQKLKSGFKNRDQAEAFAGNVAYKKVVNQGELGAVNMEGKMTLRDLFNTYRGNKSSKSVDNKINRVEQLLGDLADTKLKDIKPFYFDRLEKAVKAPNANNGKPYAPNTIADTMVFFKAALNHGRVNRYISKNTIDGLRTREGSIVKKYLGPKSRHARDRVVTPKEFQAIFDNVRSQHVKDYIMLGWWTGLRKEKILSIKWSDIDGRWLCLEKSTSSKKNPWRIYLNDDLYGYLMSHPRSNDYDPDETIVRYRGQSIDTVETGLIKAFERAGLVFGRDRKGGIVFHDLRHSFKTHSRKAGVDEWLRDWMMGHDNGHGMSTVYDRIDDEDLMDAMDDLADWRRTHPEGRRPRREREAVNGIHFSNHTKFQVISGGKH